MDQPTTTPQITTPTLPKDIALPETPAPSHFLKQEGLEPQTKEEEEEEVKEEAESKIVSSGEKEEQILEEERDAEPKVDRVEAHLLDETTHDEPSPSPIFEHHHQQSKPTEEVFHDGLVEEQATPASLPAKDGPITSATSQEPEVVGAQDSEVVEPSAADPKVEEDVDASPSLGLVLDTQVPVVPAFPPGPTVGSPIREAAHLSPLSPIRKELALPSDDIEPPSKEPTDKEATSDDVEAVERPEEVPVVARELEEEEELVPLEEITKTEPIAVEDPSVDSKPVSGLALDTSEPEEVIPSSEVAAELQQEHSVDAETSNLPAEVQEVSEIQPTVEEPVEQEESVDASEPELAVAPAEAQGEEVSEPSEPTVAQPTQEHSVEPTIEEAAEEVPFLVESKEEEIVKSSDSTSETKEVEAREDFHRSTTPSPSWSRIEQTPGAEVVPFIEDDEIVADPEETTSTSFEYPHPSPPIPDAHMIFARKRSASQDPHVPLPEEQILGHPVASSELERQMSNPDQAAVFAGHATVDDIVGPEHAVNPAIFPPTPVEELEEKVAAAPVVETIEEEKSVAEEPVAEPEAEVETQDAPVELVEKKIELPEPDLESELQEERTPVLVTPPKDAPSSPSPSSKSSVRPVFVEQAPTFVAGSMLAELLDEQTPAVESTEEELSQRASVVPVVASVEEDPASSELEVEPQAPSGAADSYFNIPGSDSNDEEKPLPKTEEEVREESVEEKIGEGILGGAGATLVGIALSPSSSEDVPELDEDIVKAGIARAEAEVSDSEETVDEVAWEGGEPLARSPPQFASMTDTPSQEHPSFLPSVVNGLPPLPTIPLATSGSVPASVLDRIEQHHQLKFATGDGLETSTSSNWASPSQTPALTTPNNELAPPNLIHHVINKDPSPVATPGEVFARGDVPSGTLTSPTGDRKHGDESNDPLDAPEASSDGYFGSNLALPREVDYASESAVVAGARPRDPPIVLGEVEVSPAVAETPLATKEDEVEVGGRETEVNVNVHQPKIVSTPEVTSPPEVQPSSLAQTDISPEPTEVPPLAVLPPQTKESPETMNLRWSLKDVSWPDPRVGGLRRELKIVCQSENGPCSLISLVNVLALRGSIHIDVSRHHVSYDYLSSLIGDFLIERPQDSKLSLASALSILPTTVEGLNLNPSFLSPSAFQQEGDGGELALFELCGVRLTHGWVVENEEDRELMGRVGTWDAAQGVLVEGQVAEAELEKAGEIADDGLEKIEDANRVRTFLDSTRTQLTPTGLKALSASLEPQEVVALFRNSHLSVLYKRPTAEAADPEDPLLFSLVTDESFRSESEVVWEPLADVHTSTGFVNSEFITSSTAGGDIAGLTAEEVGRRADLENGAGEEDLDQQLAKQLQSEEDAEAAAALATSDRRQTSSSSRRADGIPPTPSSPPAGTRQSIEQGRGQFSASGSGGAEELKRLGEKEKKKDKKGCVVM